MTTYSTLDKELISLSEQVATNPAEQQALANSITVFMQEYAADLDASAISLSIDNMAKSGYNTAVLALVGNLLPGQAGTLSGGNLNNALISLAKEVANTPIAQQSLASTLYEFMLHVGYAVAGTTISNALVALAVNNNQPAVIAVLNGLQPGQAAQLAGSSLDNALIALGKDLASTPTAQSALANTLAEFMGRVGQYVDGAAIGTALTNLAKASDQPGVMAIVNNLAPGQAISLAGPTLDSALVALSTEIANTPTAQSQLASTLAIFMNKVGMEVGGAAIGTALTNLAKSNDQLGITAVVNNLQPGQATSLAGPTLDSALVALSAETATVPVAQSQLASTLADFMQRVGADVSGTAIGAALTNLAVSDQIAVEAVVNNLQPGQARSLAGATLDSALVTLGGETANVPTAQTQLASTITDFMQKVGADVSGTAIGATLDELAVANQPGVLAVVNNLAPGQVNSLAGTNLDNALITLSKEPANVPVAQTALANTLADFMQKVGPEISQTAINTAVNYLEGVGDQTAANAIINNETGIGHLVQAMATFSAGSGAISSSTSTNPTITTEQVSLAPTILK